MPGTNLTDAEWSVMDALWERGELTGREAAALDPVYLAWPQADQYQFAWTGADDEGELACCGTLLYDGTTCYTLTIRCAAELEKTYHAEFARILAHTRRTDAA